MQKHAGYGRQDVSSAVNALCAVNFTVSDTIDAGKKFAEGDSASGYKSIKMGVSDLLGASSNIFKGAAQIAVDASIKQTSLNPKDIEESGVLYQNSAINAAITASGLDKTGVLNEIGITANDVRTSSATDSKRLINAEIDSLGQRLIVRGVMPEANSIFTGAGDVAANVVIPSFNAYGGDQKKIEEERIEGERIAQEEMKKKMDEDFGKLEVGTIAEVKTGELSDVSDSDVSDETSKVNSNNIPTKKELTDNYCKNLSLFSADIGEKKPN